MAILSKSQILQGINNPQKIKIEALDGEVWLRPLSSAEVNEILNIEAQGYGTFNASNMKGTTIDAKMNIAKMQEKQTEAKYLAIHKSINNLKNPEEWELDEISSLPNDAVNELYDQVMKLSGAEVSTADVKQFPENEGS